MIVAVGVAHMILEIVIVIVIVIAIDILVLATRIVGDIKRIIRFSRRLVCFFLSVSLSLSVVVVVFDPMHDIHRDV